MVVQVAAVAGRAAAQAGAQTGKAAAKGAATTGKAAGKGAAKAGKVAARAGRRAGSTAGKGVARAGSRAGSAAGKGATRAGGRAGSTAGKGATRAGGRVGSTAGNANGRGPTGAVGQARSTLRRVRRARRRLRKVTRLVPGSGPARRWRRRLVLMVVALVVMGFASMFARPKQSPQAMQAASDEEVVTALVALCSSGQAASAPEVCAQLQQAGTGPASVPVEGGRTVRTAGGDTITVVAMLDSHGQPIEDGSGRPVEVNMEIAPGVQALFLAAEQDPQLDDALRVVSSFRSPEDQIRLWNNCDASCRERGMVARPGRSMHEQGRAIDFGCRTGGGLRPGNPCYDWLVANAERYGLRELCRGDEHWHWSSNCH